MEQLLYVPQSPYNTRLKIMNLIPFSAPHEWRFRALVVDVGPEVLEFRNWRSLCFLDRLVDLGLGISIHFLEFILRS